MKARILHATIKWAVIFLVLLGVGLATHIIVDGYHAFDQSRSFTIAIVNGVVGALVASVVNWIFPKEEESRGEEPTSLHSLM